MELSYLDEGFNFDDDSIKPLPIREKATSKKSNNISFWDSNKTYTF